jgi:hypothetical protein
MESTLEHSTNQIAVLVETIGDKEQQNGLFNTHLPRDLIFEVWKWLGVVELFLMPRVTQITSLTD